MTEDELREFVNIQTIWVGPAVTQAAAREKATAAVE